MLQRQPTLHSERLTLRPFVSDDAAALQELASPREIADTLVTVRHPYSMATARAWIAAQAHTFGEGRAVEFALCESGRLVGSAGLAAIDAEHRQAELSFWVGWPFWGQGVATEAARRLLVYAFGERELNRVEAFAMMRNPAAGAVLRKVGMKQEGQMRQRVQRWGVFEDVACYAALAEDGPL